MKYSSSNVLTNNTKEEVITERLSEDIYLETIGVPNPSVEHEDSGRVELIGTGNLKLYYKIILSREVYDIKISVGQKFIVQFPELLLFIKKLSGTRNVLTVEFPVCSETVELFKEFMFYDATIDYGLLRFEIVVRIFRKSLKCLNQSVDFYNAPACKFLTEFEEKEKINRAIQFLDENVGSIISIRDLSKIAAMNECYLKKGFKILTGRTILEYQNEKRMNKAIELLNSGKYNVSQVADELNFSSISHFSTSFKKYRGIKPCELIK